MPDGENDLYLEGDITHSMGRRVKLNLTNVKDYSLFPGQIVVMRGVNTSGRELVVTEVHDDFAVPLKQYEPKELDNMWRDKRPCQLLCANGPFTLNDTLNYEDSPLQKLATVINKKDPKFVILFGPLVDIKNEKVQKNQLDTTFDDAAASLLTRFLKDLGQVRATQEQVTEAGVMSVIICPSTRDACADAVFPSAAYPELSNRDFDLPPSIDLMFHTNPMQMKINDFTFCMSAADAIDPLFRFETKRESKRGKAFQRLGSHLVKQRSFFPLLIGYDQFLDWNHYRDLYFIETPDVVITPSVRHYFATPTPQGTIVVNPRQLARGQSGGAFALFTLHPPREGASRMSRIRVDVTKI